MATKLNKSEKLTSIKAAKSVEAPKNLIFLVEFEKVLKVSVVKPKVQKIRESEFVPKYKLEYYWPTNAMIIGQSGNFNTNLLTTLVPAFHNYLETQQLTANNIVNIYRTLLQIEDLTILEKYPLLSQKNVNLCPQLKYIELPKSLDIEDILTAHMDELLILPPAKTAQLCNLTNYFDLIKSHSHLDKKVKCFCIHTKITKIENDRVLFKDKLQKENKYDIYFCPYRLPLRYQYYALELLDSKASDFSVYLFPVTNPCKDLPMIDLKTLNVDVGTNPEQLQAVRNIVAGPNSYAPYIIFGPPGTGKTTTIVEAILQLRIKRPETRILVTAGSNSACDTIALRLIEYIDKPNYSRTFSSNEIIRIFSKTIEDKIKDINFDLLKHSNCRKKGAHHYPAVKAIRKFAIIVATLCTVGKLVMGDLGENEFFTHIFIDEAGASTEVETLVGIIGIKSRNCQVILSGDHKQLGPVLTSKRAIELGLQQSLMERLLLRDCYAVDVSGNYDHSLQTRLRRNYRSHPEIVRIYNQLYYANELIAEAKKDDVNLYADWSILANPNFPIIFQSVHGITAKDGVSRSSFNKLEIQVLFWYLRQLLKVGINGKQVSQTDIGVVTPYKLQSVRIQQQLARSCWRAVEVGSVEKFQGREKQIIIVSLVRSFSGLGFVSEPRRMNVLLSRAKSLLIIMGNPLTLRRSPDYKFIIDECTKKGTMRYKKKNSSKAGKNIENVKLKTESIKV